MVTFGYFILARLYEEKLRFLIEPGYIGKGVNQILASVNGSVLYL